MIGADLNAGSGFFPKRLDNGGSSVISASWETDDGSDSGKLTDADFWLTDYDNHGFLTVRLPEKPRKYVEADPANVVTVKLKLHVAKGPYLGEADHPDGWKQLIVIDQKSEVVNDVMAHELGHTLNQVVNSKPPGMGTISHGRQYTGNEHQGSHCADGMSSSNYAGGAGKKGTDYEGDFSGKSECTCIMYGENGESSKCTGKFCSRCTPFLKGEALTTLH